jgi:hypothetical protein
MRGEQLGLRANKNLASRTPLMGALARTPGGAPTIRPINLQNSELQPIFARLQPPIFPDNALVLEGLHAIYLNSERAVELKDTQVSALFAWLNSGGHLIIGVEQVNDITASPWLKNVMPCDIREIQRVQRHYELQEWLSKASWSTNLNIAPAPAQSGPVITQGQQQYRRRYGMDRTRGQTQYPPETITSGPTPDKPFADLADDFTFESAEMQVATGKLRDGVSVVSAGDVPLIITAPRGLGRVTALMFSPEREPFRSWKNAPTFWAKLTEVPGEWYVTADYNQQGGRSSDGIFGAMLDSRQVHKLPIEWLLLLLVIYLVVIGPLDQYWLKRINRPMLTWITFPCYVVLFSLLIYFIGYKLRAGESEWNELHLVDVLLNGDHAELRGRTYASIYSPSNQKYPLAGPQKAATLRGEFAGSWEGGASSEKATVWQNGDSFKAEIFVPVWTSQLFVSDWWQPAEAPLAVSVSPSDQGWEVKVQNNTDRKLTAAQLVVDEYIIPLGNGELSPNQNKTFTVSKDPGKLLKDFLGRYTQTFQDAVQNRQRAFGASESGHIGDLQNSAVAASFASQMGRRENYMSRFIAPPGLDVSSAVQHGNAVLFAWASDYSPTKPMNQFSVRRTHRDTLWRFAVPVR